MVEEVKQYFTSYRSPGWAAPVETLPQEQDDQPEVQPSGWVINSSANVFIDETGLTVLDGAIFLRDFYGESVLTPAGFAGAWTDFFALGVYNGTFASGIVSSGNTATTEVGTGSTPEDYLDSLSDIVHNWVIRTRTGTGTYAMTGGTFRFTNPLAGSTASNLVMYQDVPVSPRLGYGIHIHFDFRSVGNLNVFISERDADHAIIGSESALDVWQDGGVTQSTNVDTFSPHRVVDNDNAKYVRVKIELNLDAANEADFTLRLVALKSVPLFWEDSPGQKYVFNDELEIRGDTVIQDGFFFHNQAIGRQVYKNSVQLIGSGAWAQVTGWSTTPWVGIGTQWNAGGSNGITADLGGIYVINASAQFAGASAGTRRLIGITINGGTPAQWHHQSFPIHSTAVVYMNATWIVPLAMGDVVRVYVFQDSGAGINLDEIMFGIVRIGTS